MRTRTNLHLDDDALAFASLYANAKGISLGTAVSELIRRVEESSAPVSPKLVRSKGGWLMRPKEGRVVTTEMVREISEDDGD